MTEIDLVAIGFAKWMNEPMYRYTTSLKLTPRCVMQQPDCTEFAVIDKDGRLIGGGHEYFTIEQLFEMYKLENQ